MLLHCAGCGSRSHAELSEMRIEGARLVVTCRRCGVDVVAVGWNDGPVPPDEAAPGSDGPAAVSGAEMATGRLEIEESDAPAGAPRPPEEAGKAQEAEKAEEAKAPQVLARPREPIEGPPLAEPALRPQLQPRVRPEKTSHLDAPRKRSRGPIAALGVAAAIACAALFFVLRSPSSPKSGDPASAGPPAVRTPARPAEPTPVPATPAPTLVPRADASAAARPAPPKPTAKPLAAPAVPAASAPTAAVPGAMSEAEALTSGLVDTEDFQDRTGKITTNLLFCRNLEQARNPGLPLAALDVALVVAPTGAVAEVRLDRTTARSSLGQCLREHLGKLEFPNGTGRAIEIRRHVAAAEARKAP